MVLANTDIESMIIDSAVCSVSIGMSYGLEEKYKESEKSGKISQYYDHIGREYAKKINVSYEEYIVEFLHHIQKNSNKSEAKRSANSCIADYILNVK
jgi:hypothetical protein